MAKNLPKKGSSFYGATGIIAASTFLSRILGLVREQVFAYFFGAGMATDAFQIAFRIPNLLRDLFAEGAMSSALVPVYTKLRHEKGEQSAWRLVCNVATVLSLVLTVVAVVGILFADPLVALYAPAFRLVPQKHELTVQMTRILWPFLPLVVMAAVWMGILNARERYAVPSLAPSLFNILSILAAFTLCPLVERVWGVHPIYGMAIGALLGALGQWLIQVPALRKEGFHYSPLIDGKDPALRRMVFLMGAGTFGLAATQINIFVNSVLASSQGDGAVSWLNYAFRLMQFPIGVFGVAISTANLTKVAREAARGDLQSVRNSIVQSLRMVFFLTVPSAVGLAVFGIPILSVIYQRGRFGAEDTFATSMALAGYAIGLSAYSAIKVMVPVLYSMGRSNLAILSSGLSVVTNLFLCLLLVNSLGFFGLSLATSGSSILNAIVLLWLLERVVKQIDFKEIWDCLWKTILASTIMAIFLYILMGFVGLTPFRPIPLTSLWDKANFATHVLFLLGALVAAVFVYGVSGKVLKLQELEKIQEIVWKRLNPRKD